jgi:hypothetical protein
VEHLVCKLSTGEVATGPDISELLQGLQFTGHSASLLVTFFQGLSFHISLGLCEDQSCVVGKVEEKCSEVEDMVKDRRHCFGVKEAVEGE